MRVRRANSFQRARYQDRPLNAEYLQSPPPLDQYGGTYWKDILAAAFTPTCRRAPLVITFQALWSVKFPLRGYTYDTFSWWMPHNSIMEAPGVALSLKMYLDYPFRRGLKGAFIIAEVSAGHGPP